MSLVQTFTTSTASDWLLSRVRVLLERSFEDGFSAEDWDHTLGGHHFVITEGDAVLAHAAVVPRALTVGRRLLRTGYVEGVATQLQARGHGLGSAVMTEAAGVIRAHYEMGGLSTDRHGFFVRLGWERWRGPSYVRRREHLVRTTDEDKGLMVLRHGPNASLDLSAPICCEERPGDDW